MSSHTSGNSYCIFSYKWIFQIYDWNTKLIYCIILCKYVPMLLLHSCGRTGSSVEILDCKTESTLQMMDLRRSSTMSSSGICSAPLLTLVCSLQTDLIVQFCFHFWILALLYCAQHLLYLQHADHQFHSELNRRKLIVHKMNRILL